MLVEISAVFISKKRLMELKITAVPKPRMTRADSWKKRACVQRYWAYKDELRLLLGKDFVMPESDYHLIFYLPMPKSWSEKKKAEFQETPHQSRPDKDNLEKAFLDAVCEEDSQIWDGRVTKLWGDEGRIILNLQTQ